MPETAGKPAWKGYVQVYTGDGKGKTTAALGLAVRAAGHGLRTYIAQFLKGRTYGELAGIKALSRFVTIEQFGRKDFIHVTADGPGDGDVRRARAGLEAGRRAMLSGRYAIVVLDEINVALFFKLLTRREVEAVLDERPPGVELVLTGRRAPAWLVRRADLVTEMRSRKHYYDRGVRARDGIET